jgi:hypothetical protein
MTEPKRSFSLTLWWDQNRTWVRPVGCLALLLPFLSCAGCAGTVLTLLFGAAKLGTFLRKRET